MRSPKDPRDPARTPMQWNGNSNGGFSSAASTWLPVNPDFASGVSVQAQEEAAESHLKVYQALTAMRSHKSILFGSVNTTADAATGLFAYNRVKKGNPGYAVVANLGDSDLEAAFLKPPPPAEGEDAPATKAKDLLPFLPATGTVHLRSTPAKASPGGGGDGDAAAEEGDEELGKTVDFTSFKLKAKEAIVVTFVPKF